MVRKVDGKVIKCKIVETESYIGAIDKASHAYNGRRTERTEPLFHSGGISYVYFIYGLVNYSYYIFVCFIDIIFISNSSLDYKYKNVFSS